MINNDLIMFTLQQIATSSQVGREMNEIRRNKIKERALNNESTKANEFVYRRTKSMGNGISSFPLPDKHDAQHYKRERRSQSANAEYLRNQIRQSFPTGLETVPSEENLTTDTPKANETSPEAVRDRTQSLPVKDVRHPMVRNV